jgi:hypothetical protein
MLSYGPTEVSDGCPVVARCALLWRGTDGVERHVGSLEKLMHPEGGTSYQWSTPRLAASTRDGCLDAVVLACQTGDLPSGDKV